MTEQNQTDLGMALWAMVDELRGSVYLRDFHDYMLSLLCLYSLSENYEQAAKTELGAEWPTLLDGDRRSPLAVWYEQNEKGIEGFEAVMRHKSHFIIKPEFLWSTIAELARTENAELLETLRQSFRFIENESCSLSFKGLFSEVNLDFWGLGESKEERNARLCTIIAKIAGCLAEFPGRQELLGDAVEFLIERFAVKTSRRVGEFYTPPRVSDIVAGIVTLDNQNPALGKREKLNRVYDFACGAGSLLLNVRRQMGERGIGKLYGQEIENTTYNLTRMNMLLHGLRNSEFEIHHGDTLENDWDILREPNPAGKIEFDAVVANPTFSYPWKPREEMARDFRFRDHGVAPVYAADFAFVLHGFHYLAEEGTMAIVLHSGALLRGLEDKKIREKLLRDGNIDTVIGLPYSLFYSTGSLACILVLKKCVRHDDVLIINAVKQCEKSGYKNRLLGEHVRKIIETYQYRAEEGRFSRRVTLDEIEKHDFNLDVSLYVNTDEPEVDPQVFHQQPADLGQRAVSEAQLHGGYVTEKGSPPKTLNNGQGSK